jgi:hypothetical protein
MSQYYKTNKKTLNGGSSRITLDNYKNIIKKGGVNSNNQITTRNPSTQNAIIKDGITKILKPDSTLKIDNNCINTITLHNNNIYIGTNKNHINIYSQNDFKLINTINVVKGPIRNIIINNNKLYFTSGTKNIQTRKIENVSYPNVLNVFNLIDVLSLKYVNHVDNATKFKHIDNNMLITSVEIKCDHIFIGYENGTFEYSNINKEYNLNIDNPIYNIVYRDYKQNKQLFTSCEDQIFIWSLKIKKNKNNTLNKINTIKIDNLKFPIYNISLIDQTRMVISSYEETAKILNIENNKIEHLLPSIDNNPFTDIGDGIYAFNNYYFTAYNSVTKEDVCLIFNKNEYDKPKYILKGHTKDINDIKTNNKFIFTVGKDGVINKYKQPFYLFKPLTPQEKPDALKKLQNINYAKNQNIGKQEVSKKLQYIQKLRKSNENETKRNKLELSALSRQNPQTMNKANKEKLNAVKMKKEDKEKFNAAKKLYNTEFKSKVCMMNNKNIIRKDTCDGQEDEVFGEIPTGQGICHLQKCYDGCEWKKAAQLNKKVRMDTGKQIKIEEFQSTDLNCPDYTPTSVDINDYQLRSLNNIHNIITQLPEEIRQGNFRDLPQDLLNTIQISMPALLQFESFEQIEQLRNSERIRIDGLVQQNRQAQRQAIQAQRAEPNSQNSNTPEQIQLRRNRLREQRQTLIAEARSQRTPIQQPPQPGGKSKKPRKSKKKK